jgi:Holliday junction resolvase RusA-like endonuclease
VSYTVVADTPKALRWMAEVAAYAVQERRRLEARGERSFPYEAPLHLEVLFVYPRPLTGSLVTGPPVVCTGPNAVGDLDKLVRSVGDALPPGEIYLEESRMRVAKAGVIKDDSQITKISARKAFSDEVGGRSPGCYLWLRHADRNPV